MSAGLLLPVGVVQPFDLRHAVDDLHVMAFFAGDDDYEAVEAMIRRLPGGAHRVRAILTRHDQTQIDHVNDADALRAVQSLQRETCLREISVIDEDTATGRRVAVRFVSARGEQVELDVTSAGPPDPARGGLSDPGRHSLRSSLPIMWRGKSALAAPASRVAIDGVARAMPARVRVGARVVALEGYLSEWHCMAALRAGSDSYELIEQPARFEPGARWLLRGANGERAYRIARADADGMLAIVGSGAAPETLAGRIVGERFQLARLGVGDAAGARSEAVLAFDASGGFSIGIDATPGLVTGTAAVSDLESGACEIRLQPNEPAWARLRPVDIRVAARGRTISITTSIGAPSTHASALAPCPLP
jgi:hypothetical protein